MTRKTILAVGAAGRFAGLAVTALNTRIVRVVLARHDMGALPALLWAADDPLEVEALLYIDAPVMLSAVLERVFAYTPQAMAEGSMWWWILRSVCARRVSRRDRPEGAEARCSEVG